MPRPTRLRGRLLAWLAAGTPASLRGRLLAWVVLPLAGAVAIDGWITYSNAHDTATAVQDRLLLGAARIVAEPLRFEDGVFQHAIPPAALELFEAGHGDRVYYRVSTGSGQSLVGYDDLAAPAVALQPEAPHHFNTQVRGAPVRAVAFLQPVVGAPDGLPVLVVIGQTLAGHADFTRSLWLHALAPQLLLLLLTALLVALGLRRGLQPLITLRDLVLSRRPGTLQPLALASVPAELGPLVAAINDYIGRLEAHAGAQQAFVQNAAHQLRTPLAVLHTQVAVAARAADLQSKDHALAALRQTVQQAVRLINQLLTLSSADVQGGQATPGAAGAALPGTAMPVNALDVLVRQVLEDVSALAQAKSIDLGYEQTGTNPVVRGNPVALREMVHNLVDNALRYTPAGGVVTVRVQPATALPQSTHQQSGGPPAALELQVEDNGPGIAPALHAAVFQRFFRIDNTQSQGCGLGLPIVAQFAASLGASVSLGTPAGGQGLLVTLRFAAPAPPQPAAGSVHQAVTG